MATITINSPRFAVLEYVKKLRQANLTQEQAETIAQETEHVIEVVIENTRKAIASQDLATKSDVELAKLELKNAIKNLEIKLMLLYSGLYGG